MQFKPINDRVLVSRAAAETTTAGGFIIPDAIAERTNKGTVLAVGPGKTSKEGVLIPMTVQIDDVVMFAPGSGLPVKVNGVEYTVLQEDEIIAVIVE